MNRIPHSSRDVEASREGPGLKPPLESLLLDRAGLIRILKRSLFELHQNRDSVKGTSAEPGAVQWINYWAEVLAWVKDQPGGQVILVGRRA